MLIISHTFMHNILSQNNQQNNFDSYAEERNNGIMVNNIVIKYNEL